MNRFNQGTWSKLQCEMILALLSFADYFRPRYFLLENVRTFVSFNKGQTFRLTLTSLLEMGYSVKFGVLNAGAYGVSQSKIRAFIWAVAPDETLPDWPEPMHVLAGTELGISLPGNAQYSVVRSTAGGVPFSAISVRDTIGDLPPVGNGVSKTEMESTTMLLPGTVFYPTSTITQAMTIYQMVIGNSSGGVTHGITPFDISGNQTFDVSTG